MDRKKRKTERDSLKGSRSYRIANQCNCKATGKSLSGHVVGRERIEHNYDNNRDVRWKIWQKQSESTNGERYCKMAL